MTSALYLVSMLISIKAVPPVAFRASMACKGTTLPLKFIHIINNAKETRTRKASKNSSVKSAYRFNSRGSCT